MESSYEKYEFIRYSNDPTDTLLEDLMPLLRAQDVSCSIFDILLQNTYMSKASTCYLY